MSERDEILAQLKSEHPDWGAPKLSDASGISRSAVGRWLARERKKALTGNATNFAGYDKPQPVGFCINKTTVHYDKNGEVVQQWVKSKQDTESMFDLLQIAVDDMANECRGKSVIVPLPKHTNDDLLCIYPIADVHMGLYAWADEVGADWDTEKCEAAIVGGMTYLVDSAPNAETCYIPNLADFFHTDNERNQTERSGHSLDVDTRQAKVFLTGVRSYRKMVELALTKHKRVVCKFSKGNHDDRSILALAVVMQAYFENNDRVEISLPINPFSYFEFGVNMYGQHHGNLKKDRYPGIMASDEPEMWGRTKYRTFLTGHIHNETKFEAPGCMVESFRSPTVKDSWTHGSGYRAGRDMQLIVAHITRGEISRTRIGIDNL